MYVDGDTVEVWSTGQQKWVRAVVTKVQGVLITVEYADGSGTKTLEAAPTTIRKVKVDISTVL